MKMIGPSIADAQSAIEQDGCRSYGDYRNPNGLIIALTEIKAGVAVSQTSR
jgi:hypothetical protein